MLGNSRLVTLAGLLLALVAGLVATRTARTGGKVLPGERVSGPTVPATVSPATVSRATPPGRIVSLMPAATEILFAIGAGDRLVGRTRWDVHPEAARRLPDLGDGVRPALEMVVAQDPGLVILFGGRENDGVSARLQALGIATLALEHSSLADLERNIRILGDAVGCRGSAERLRTRIRADLAALAASTGPLPLRSVYYDVWDAPPITIGRGSYLDSLLHLAGGRNIFGDLADPSPQVGLEAIIERDPDLVLLPVSRSERRVRIEPGDRPGWTAVPAVSAGRVVRVDGDLVHRLGPRVAEAVLELARAIHPQLPGWPELGPHRPVESCTP